MLIMLCVKSSKMEKVEQSCAESRLAIESEPSLHHNSLHLTAAAFIRSLHGGGLRTLKNAIGARVETEWRKRA